MTLLLHLGCRLSFDVPVRTPMIAMLTVHPSRADHLEQPDRVTTEPPVRVHSYTDGFGNTCTRLVAPAGRFTISTDGLLRDDAGLADPVGQGAEQHPVEDLPDDVITYLLPSRYCENDVLSDEAWRRFNRVPGGWYRVQAVCDFVNTHIRFGYAQSRPTRTAVEAMRERAGVCRDFAHLAVALCRSLNIPARYCTGYISDVGQPPPYAPMDFAAWIEVYLGGQWWTFDPRNNDTRFGRVLIARGRDAADVPLTHTFGRHDLTGFEVWIDQVRRD